MLYFDNIKFLNLDYIFGQVFKLIVNVPEYIIYSLFFWVDIVQGFWARLFLWLLTFFFSAVFFYSIYKIWELNQKEWANYLALFAIPDSDKTGKKIIDQRWVDIIGHMESLNPSNWVIAVIECDKILDDVLKERGYEGTNIGERLKSIPKGSLNNLNEAWEAHKIRNKIAHETGYILERREAQKAVSYYEAVFKELGFL